MFDDAVHQTRPEDMIKLLSLSLYDGSCRSVSHYNAASWIGDAGDERALVRKAYLDLFDWTDLSVLAAVRDLCERLYMKAESQQLDRIVDSFADRWCECNPLHAFGNPSVIYTLAYSILLLNTDHHSEEYAAGKKMPRSQYVQSTLDAMRTLALDGKLEFPRDPLAKVDPAARNAPSKKRWTSSMTGGGAAAVDNTTLVNDSKYYTVKEWEFIVTTVLKSVYSSVDMVPLNLAVPESDGQNQPPIPRRSSWVNPTDTWSDYDYSDAIANNNNNNNQGGRRRSVFSYDANGKPIPGTPQDQTIGFAGALWSTIIREEQEKAQNTTRDDSTVKNKSLDDDDDSDSEQMTTIEVRDFTTVEANSIFSGSSVESADNGGMQHLNYRRPSEGILEVGTHLAPPRTPSVPSEHESQASKATDAQREQELSLNGAPWAKEGLLKFQAFFEKDAMPKKYKKKTGWTDVFVVVQRGYLKMFQFDKHGPGGAAASSGGGSSTSTKKKSILSSRSKSKNSNNSGASSPALATPTESSLEVGHGNWLDNATMTDDISLCHTTSQIIHIAPDGTDLLGMLPGSSSKITKKANLASHIGDNVQWSLKLPNGGVLAFLAGTREIADEYVYTCNYWAARVSREPLVEAVSSSEFGWDKPLRVVFRRGSQGSGLGSPVSSGAGDGVRSAQNSVSLHSHSPASSTTDLKLRAQASNSSSGSAGAVIATKSMFARTLLRKQPVQGPNGETLAQSARGGPSLASPMPDSGNGTQYARITKKPSSAAAASAAATAAATSLLGINGTLLTSAALSTASTKNKTVFERVTAQRADGGNILSNGPGGKKFYVASGSFDVLFINNILINIAEWHAPLQSASHSPYMEDESAQLASLKRYTRVVDDTLEIHTGQRGMMMAVYTANLMVSARVTGNWERRSRYLLHEAVKYDTYVVTLGRAMEDRARVSGGS